jgi:L-Ala-D/L-Glu epimerase
MPVITHINIYKLSIPMHPFTIATGTMEFAQNVFIRVHTDAGYYGVGECSAFPMIVGETQNTCYAVAQDFANMWKGKEALEMNARLAEINTYAKNTTIKSAFDMALHDIAAKHAQQPLYAYFGGINKVIESDITVGIDTPQTMAEQALAFKNNGAHFIKVKLGKGAEADVERIKAIREAIGFDIKIRIDANQGWTYDEALFALNALGKYDIQFCEQPMRTWNDALLPTLRKNVPVKIMADESVYLHYDAMRLIEADACDYINIKLSKSGGLQEAKRIVDVAEKAGIPCMMGGMLESRLALTANVHFAVSQTNILFYDMDTCLLGHKTDPIVGGVQFNGYNLQLPDAVGIGADVDDTFLAACEQVEL